MKHTSGFLIKSHAHGQFYFQIFSFLPFKEIAWYPIIFYPSYVTSERINFTSKWGRAALFGLVSILTDITYEMSNGREGVSVAFINPNCDSSVLTRDNRFL